MTLPVGHQEGHFVCTYYVVCFEGQLSNKCKSEKVAVKKTDVCVCEWMWVICLTPNIDELPVQTAYSSNGSRCFCIILKQNLDWIVCLKDGQFCYFLCKIH